jgi:glutathione S-transferase
MTLYDHPDCPYGMKVRIVLAEKDMDCEVVTVDVQSGQHRQPEFLKLNPFGRVPVLVDEGCVIYDSTIINEYLDDEYPEPALRPADSDERARVRLLEDYADTAFTLPAMALQNELAKATGTRDEARVKAARDVVVKTLEMLNRELEGKAYLGGDEFSLADVAFAPMVLQLEKLGVHLDSTTLKNVKAWAQRLVARPSMAKVPRLVA